MRLVLFSMVSSLMIASIAVAAEDYGTSITKDAAGKPSVSSNVRNTSGTTRTSTSDSTAKSAKKSDDTPATGAVNPTSTSTHSNEPPSKNAEDTTEEIGFDPQSKRDENGKLIDQPANTNAGGRADTGSSLRSDKSLRRD